MAFALPLLGAAPVASILGGALGTVAGALLQGGKKGAPAPTPEAAKPIMPLANDDAVLRAKKRAAAAQSQRGGRASTLLTSDSTGLSSTLGG